ncbi:hypothetical protein PGT21_024814 [Puccinia graminis f. sp. tritici]|uniref:Uncharacterized protein n=1 Tax=Puccinia graminis f. sp. tritici TaxID=56615 RepID=A0A5B0PRY0_PUCGR|nr:hypothetical protein PGTUg99_022690 [Puccinia graminis f. sp. tritici]KAA1104485.1 hypothetical protein PGT21_024814 [Puccinia graminis f. sp. tritici]KAA1130981.1 hypothetical protein PGTUg99_020193 [Puccinia graminis f. sp. tritici]
MRLSPRPAIGYGHRNFCKRGASLVLDVIDLGAFMHSPTHNPITMKALAIIWN